MAGRTEEGLRHFVVGLCLFAPLGIGYAMSWQEAMELDSDVAEFMWEEKKATIDAVARAKK